MDIRLALMCGVDIPIPQIQTAIHQPTMKEISYIGESDFFVGIQSLGVDASKVALDEKSLGISSNFQIFMTMMQSQEFADKKAAVQQVMTLCFPNQKALFTPRSILLQPIGGGESQMIDETNFEALQEIIRMVFCLSSQESQQMGFNPVNKKAKEIADKLMRGRQRIAEMNGQANASIFSQYISSLSIGLQMPLSELTSLTMFQLMDLIERYQLYISWDIDLRSRLAGGKPDEKPDNWMKNIH